MKFITNKEKQERLDLAKYLASEKAGRDLAGMADHCFACPYQEAEAGKIIGCKVSHEERVEKTACAKAWNHLERELRKMRKAWVEGTR